MPLRHATTPVEGRAEPRDEVHHRTRGRTAGGLPLSLVVVNTSAGGMMARCDAIFHPGDKLTVTLPLVGEVAAEVRWALGGRIGCQFDKPLAPSRYYALLGLLGRH